MVIIAMYVNMTNYPQEVAKRTIEALVEIGDRMKSEGIRMILMPIVNDSAFLNRIECIYPRFVAMSKDEIAKMEKLDQAVKDSMDIDAVIETLMKKIYSEK